MGNEQASTRVAESGENHLFSNQALKPLEILIHLHRSPHFALFIRPSWLETSSKR
jgi:hypothetical protein